MAAANSTNAARASAALAACWEMVNGDAHDGDTDRAMTRAGEFARMALGLDPMELDLVAETLERAQRAAEPQAKRGRKASAAIGGAR